MKTMSNIIKTGLIFSGLLIPGCGDYSPNAHITRQVIIDTDGGIDDMRAMLLLLASPDIHVLAITTSTGVLTAHEASIKVSSLCNSLGRTDVPIGISQKNPVKAGRFPLAENYRWGDESLVDTSSFRESVHMIRAIFNSVKNPITLVCLGGLTTAIQVIHACPEFQAHTREILWSAHSANDTKGFNYSLDASASQHLLSQKKIPFRIIQQFDIGKGAFFSTALLDSIQSLNNEQSQLLTDFFDSETVKKHEFAFRATDEMTALYLHSPSLFSTTVEGNVTVCTPNDSTRLRESFLDMLETTILDAAGIKAK